MIKQHLTIDKTLQDKTCETIKVFVNVYAGQHVETDVPLLPELLSHMEHGRKNSMFLRIRREEYLCP